MPTPSRKSRPPVALTIAGSDPSGGAGQEADLKAFLRHGVYGLNLTTLLTVQNTLGVSAVRTLDPAFLEKQWKALFADFRPDVIKLGALGALPMAKRVIKLLNTEEARGIPVVFDPVLGSTSGSPLLDPKALALLRRTLLPRSRVVTPNLPEFDALFGPFNAPTTAKTAPERLRSLGRLPYAILLKGGHGKGTRSDDWLWDDGKLFVLPGKRLPVGNVHGTGCTMASSIAANLAQGKNLATACRAAKAFVSRGIARAPDLGKGFGPLDFMG
jgi:hydroxymethylpyrimidine/phosphomethylpyrimidine kinase